jgi:putative lipoprotein
MIARVVRSSVVVLLLAVPAAGSVRTNAWVSGSATYRERMSLPHDAVFQAELVDVSRADQPGQVVARTRRSNPGQVPIAFQIVYDPRRISPRRTYAVRATIRVAGALRFASDENDPVLTHGHGSRVSILMRAARGSGGEERGPASALENNRWVPVQIGDAMVTAAGRGEPWIELDPHSQHVTGSGGCNRINGSYDAGNGTLRFVQMMTTQMACPAMKTETAFLIALEDTRHYRIRGRVLELLNDAGRTLARLEEHNLK